MDDRNLIAVAEQAAATSRVIRGARAGATVLADDGRTFLGCRLEFADSALDLDAVSNGIAAGRAQGLRRVVRVGYYEPTESGLPTLPAATLQRLHEIAAPGLVVIFSAGRGEYQERTLADLRAQAGLQ
ncbi:MAG TPA: hypothetical protein VGC54_07995 [Planctomycetota bacterium]